MEVITNSDMGVIPKGLSYNQVITNIVTGKCYYVKNFTPPSHFVIRIKCCKRKNLMNWNKIRIMKNYLSDAIYKTMFYVNSICL